MGKTRKILMSAAAVIVAGIQLLQTTAFAAGETDAASRGERGETVYVDMDASGNVLSMISSVYISNPDKLEYVEDNTTLQGIKNITGNEAPEIAGTHAVFAADGEDVCYQGNAQGELPFSIKISYRLNGRVVTPEEIAGASGEVEIRIETENNLKRTAVVDGETMELYVPFSVICMLNLNDRFSAITAEGAKINAQGGQITVLAVLLPGLAEDLDLEDNDDVRDSLIIKADVREFELDPISFIGMTGIIDENDLSGIDDIGTLVDALDEIGTAATDLYSGSKKLYYGMDEFKDGFELYAEGIGEAAEGSKEAAEGSVKLVDGAMQIGYGMNEIAKALAEMDKQVADAVEEVNKALDPDAPVDPEQKEAIEKVVEKILDDYEDDIKADVAEELDKSLEPYVKDPTLRKEIVDGIIANMDFGTGDVDITDEQIKEIKTALADNEDVQGLLKNLNDVSSGIHELSKGANEVTYYMGELTMGISKLSEGLETLAEGMKTLDENGETMSKAVKTMYRGLGALTEGLKALSEEGLEKVVSETNKVGISISRKNALIELSEQYNSFTGVDTATGDTVQFIISTDDIVMELPIEPEYDASEAVTEPAVDDEPGFFERIGNWLKKLFTKQ